MYHARARGKGGYEVFAPEMYEALRDRLALEGDLRGALERGEFHLVYQPIPDLHTERVVGAEALLRWRHPERGVVSPVTFVPTAEESGAILALGKWVLGAACRQDAAWRAAVRAACPTARPTWPSTSPGGSSSARASRPTWPRRSTARDSKPRALLLEITEGVVMRDTERTLATLRALKALGVRVAIDDFGTGYSSLSDLQRSPVDVLEIDKAFVDRVAHGGSEAALRALGCDPGQGYLCARPLAPSDPGRPPARAPGAAPVR